MQIHQIQNYHPGENAAASPHFIQMINSLNKRWEEKDIKEGSYRSQLALIYSCLYKAEECKKQQQLIPASATNNEKAEGLVSVARILIYEKNIKEALRNYEQAFALEPNHTTAIEEAGWCCFELGEWELAQGWFEKGCAVDANDSVFWDGLGRSLAQQQKFREAIAAFEKTLELVQNQKRGYIYFDLIGQCYAALNDFYRALNCYTKSLAETPGYAKALNDLAALYANEENDLETAIHYLKNAEVIAEKENNLHLRQCVYTNLCRIYSRKKEFEQHEYYKAKLMDVLGVGSMFEEDDEDETGEDMNELDT